MGVAAAPLEIFTGTELRVAQITAINIRQMKILKLPAILLASSWKLSEIKDDKILVAYFFVLLLRLYE